MLNRGVVMVTPRQPYLDWAESLDDSGLRPEAVEEQTIDRVPGCLTDEEAWDILELVYADLCENARYSIAEDAPSLVP